MSARHRANAVQSDKDTDLGTSPKKGATTSGNHHNSRQESGHCCLWCVGISLATVFVMVAVIWAIPSPIDPISFRYHDDPCPEFVGPMEINHHLKQGNRLFENEIVGPEGFAIDSDGRVYTGLADGRIIRLSEDLKSYETVVRTGSTSFDKCETLNPGNEKLCGRPLGLHFNPNNEDELYVSDSSIGLIKVNIKSKEVVTLVPANSVVGDRRILNFPNDLVVLANETIFYTDSSKKFSRDQNRHDFFESRANGELLYYNPSDESYGVLKDGLFFPNGLCLTHDNHALLIAETTRARIIRYYLDGPSAGKTDVFVDNLPGAPDNISPSSSGGYWVGIAVVRSTLIDAFSEKLYFLRSVITKLSLFPIIERLIPKHGLVLELDHSGLIIRSLHDSGGEKMFATSQVLELKDRLLIGSYFDPFILEVLM